MRCKYKELFIKIKPILKSVNLYQKILTKSPDPFILFLIAISYIIDHITHLSDQCLCRII